MTHVVDEAWTANGDDCDDWGADGVAHTDSDDQGHDNTAMPVCHMRNWRAVAHDSLAYHHRHQRK